MKYLIIFLILTNCSQAETPDPFEISLDKSIEILTECNEILTKNNAKLDCLNEMFKVDFNKLIDKECLKTKACVRAYIDKWDDECIKRKLEK